MSSGAESSWIKTFGSTLIGMTVGLSVGLLLGIVLLGWFTGVEFAPPRTFDRLSKIAPVVIGLFAVFGGISVLWGKNLLKACEQVLLPSGLDRQVRMLYWFAALVAVAALVHEHILAFVLRNPTDLPSFIYAARAMAAGQNFYDASILPNYSDGSTQETEVFPYLYLPLYAVLLRPLSLLWLAGGHAVFLCLNMIFWFALIYLCLRLINAEERFRTPLSILIFLMIPTFFPALLTLHHGSPSLLVAVLVVAVFVLEREGKSRWAGVLLALVVLIKIIPAILIPYFLLRKRFQVLKWAAIAGCVLMGLSVAVAGVQSHIHWFTQMAPGLAYGAETGSFFDPGCHGENQSITGMVCRFGGEESFASNKLYASILGAIVVLFAGFVLWRRRNPDIDRLEASLIVVTILLVSTITWFHHMTMMLLPALTLIVCGAEKKSRWGVVVLCSGLLVLAGIGFKFYLDPWPIVGANPLSRTIRFQLIFFAYAMLSILLLTTKSSKNAGSGEADGGGCGARSASDDGLSEV